MFFKPGQHKPHLQSDPFKALVAPRPIGWISTRARDGRLNLAPYSYFNALCDDPWLVAFASDGAKDSATFAADSGEFVCNIVTAEFAECMVATSVDAPRGVSEFGYAGLESEPSAFVGTPRVKGIKAALECRVTEIIHPKLANGVATAVHLVVGEVVGIFVDESIVFEGKVTAGSIHQVTRLGGLSYGLIGETFAMARPKWQE